MGEGWPYEGMMDAYVTLLERLVCLESPSMEPQTKELVTYLAGLLTEVGADVEGTAGPAVSGALVARWGTGENRVLLLAHADTVWPAGEIIRRPFRVENQFAWGPGVHDMKGSLAMGVLVMKVLQSRGALLGPVTMIVNIDEESGSPLSRKIIEREAQRSKTVLVLEPPGPNGELKTSRKGVGLWDIEIVGKTAHAGHPENGRSAILELAKLIKVLHGMTDYPAGVYVNVGVIEGGTRSNVIPDRARALVDVRVPSLASSEELAARFRSLEVSERNLAVKITGGLNRPPMERTAANARLFCLAQGLAAQKGYALLEASVGGGSDGSFTSSLGIPTLDGLGVLGSGAHSDREYVDLRAFPRSAVLLSELITCLTQGAIV